MKSVTKAHFALLGANLIYALNYSVAKDVMGRGYVPPFAFILFRIIGATLLFWALAGLSNEKVDRRDHWRIALCAIFGIAANQLMFFAGLAKTTEINAAIIMTSNPVLVLLMARIIIGEALSWTKSLGICLGIGGAAYLILGNGSLTAGSETIAGDLLIFGNATSYGIYLILVKSLMKKYDAITVIRWVFTYGLIYVIPFGLFQIDQVNWDMPVDIVLQIGYVIVFTTFFAYVLNVFALKNVSPTVVSAYIYLQPLLATIIALMRGADVLSAEKVVSAVCIFAGVYLVSLKLKKVEKG